MLADRGVSVDHAKLHRWSIKILSVLTAMFRRRKRPIGRSWRMDETNVKVEDQRKYPYQAVDRDGNTVDFLLRAKRDHAAARALFERAIDLHDVSEKITTDKSGSNTAAIGSIQADSGVSIEMGQSKYLKNLVEQSHRGIKRITCQMLSFKTFRCARILIAGIEAMHMICKGQLGDIKDRASSAANQSFHWLCDRRRPRCRPLLHRAIAIEPFLPACLADGPRTRVAAAKSWRGDSPVHALAV